MSHFYALMNDYSVKSISLKAEIVDEVKNKFINSGNALKPEGIEEDVFDGDMAIRDGENIAYVNFSLPDSFSNIPDNQADISNYEIDRDLPKSIFYYDNGIYFFQLFNRRNLLQRKMILRKEIGNTFAKINESAFIIEDKIHAIYENGKLYFKSYNIANKIFSLENFVIEATEEEINRFDQINGISVDVNRIKNIANVKTRRLIKLLSNSGNIETFKNKPNLTKNKLLREYNINAQINNNGELLLPTNNAASLNRVLEFLNEDIFKGIITNNIYRSNSKKMDNI